MTAVGGLCLFTLPPSSAHASAPGAAEKARERIGSALDNFFTGENLTRLREMALDEIRHLLDRRRQTQNAEAPTPSGRVMVCLSSQSPVAEQLLRKAARLADRLGAPWYAVYIQTPSEELERIDAATERRIHNTLTLTQQMGGTPWQFKGRDVVSAVAAFANEYGITHIVMGRTQRPWYRRLFSRSVLEGLLQAVPHADVIVVGSR